MASDFTFTPDRLKAYLTNKGSYSPKVTVTAPDDFKFDQARFDIYFLADNTGSMGPTIDAVNKRANDILSELRNRAKEVNADVHYGVGYYKDYGETDVFKHQQSLAEDGEAAVKALGQWSASGGGFGIAEAQFLALHQIAEDTDGKGGKIGWRQDAKRIVIWIGDAPANDPIPKERSGLAYDLTEQVVTDRLNDRKINVIAISVVENNPGLDADPVKHAGEYAGKGESGQATRISTATGGTMADKLKASEVVDRIIDLGKEQISKMAGLSLKARPKLARYDVTATPASAIPPAAGSRQVNFNVTIPFTSERAAPATTKDWPYGALTGELDLTVAGKPTGDKVEVELVQADLSGTYEIQNASNDQLLDLTVNGLGVTPDRDENHQRWTLVPIKGGGYLLENNDAAARNRYVVRRDGSAEAAGYSTSGAHQWMLIPEGVNGRGYLFSIQPLQAWKKALGFSGGKLTVTDYNGTNYSGGQFAVDHKHNQLWRLNAI